VTDFIYQVLGNYGRNWKPGVLIDDLGRAENIGLTIRYGNQMIWVVSDDDGVAYPVVCGDIVMVPQPGDDPGEIDGRCGIPVEPGKGACEGHDAQHAEWAQQTEAEIIEWEMNQEAMYG
jgi:hypothetical protein